MSKQRLMQEAYIGSNNKAQRLVEAWGDRIDVVEQVNGEDMSYDRKLVLAQCLQNTKEQLDLLEATDAHDTDGFKHFALDLVTAV